VIGKTISHYKIIEKLGAGGMGVVYKAQDIKLDRFVALKFLPPHLTTSEEEKQRFIHEAKAASSLDHNNICNIYEIDETEDGQLFISMACYEGDTLDNKIKDKPLPIDEANDISIQIAQGLAKAHEKEIVHRDIKPANIMLTADRVVKILDFGLAKLSTQTKLTKESTTLGTVSYMSPEQAKGEEVDYRTDIWSIGVILYEMLTGQLPFKGEYESAVIYSILNDTQEPVTGLRTGMPMELERIINKCLQKNPANRYQHVDELIVDLRSMKRESESASIPTKIEYPSKHSKPIKMSVAVLSILILIVAGYFILIQPSGKSISGWENSIAVLPFDDLSPEGDQEWFCDGMTEQIITNLSKIKRLKVIGRTSIMKFKNTNKTLPEIGQELNVSHILEGSIRKHEDNIRVTAQLISSEDGSHLWADDFDRKLDDIFIVQDDISEEIATILLATLSPQEQNAIKTNRPSNTEAYEYYMQGRYYHYNKFFSSNMKEDFLSSERMFKQAIKLDPNFSDSYASLADLYNSCYFKLPDTVSEKSDYMQLQEAYIDSASQLNPNSAEVFYAKGVIHQAKNEDGEAFSSFKNAIKINPNNDYYYFGFGMFLHFKGLNNLALKCLTKAIELNPLNSLYYRYRGFWHIYLRKYDDAERDLTKALEIDDNYINHTAYWIFLINLKKYEEAEKLLIQMETNHPDEIWNDEYALLYAVNGQKENALNTFKSGFDLDAVWFYSILGMKDEAISILQDRIERNKKTNSSSYLFLKNNAIYDSLRSDPRFHEILAKHKEIYEENLKKYGDIDI